MDKKNKNPNVPNLRFPLYQNKWECKKIKDILKICHGRDYKHLESGKYPVLGTSGIFAYVNQYLCDWPCALIGRKGASLDKPHYMDSPFWCVDTLYYSKPIKNNNPKWQYYLFQTINWMKMNESSGIPSLRASTIENIDVFVPSYQEQTKIVEFLNTIDQRIQTQIKIIENLYSQRKCIFLQLNNNYHHNKIKINELGPVSIANNLSKDDLVDDGRKCILYGELFTKYDLYTTHAISKTNKTYHIITSSGNDLLFPTSTTVNALSLIKPLALCQKDIILGGDMFSIKLNDTYNAIYISCLINYVYKKQLASKTQGTTIVHLYYENIKNEIIEICDYEIQCKIAEYIKFITSKIETEKELLNKLHLQKAFLLRNLFI